MNGIFLLDRQKRDARSRCLSGLARVLPSWVGLCLVFLAVLGCREIGDRGRFRTEPDASSPSLDAGPSGQDSEASTLNRDESQLVAGSRIYPLEDYLKDCEAALGPAPQLSCADAVPYDYGLTREIDGRLMCARPTLNNPLHACVPGTALARYTRTVSLGGSDQMVDWVMICIKILPDAVAQRFHNIDVIGYNRSTGDTCFFKSAEIGVDHVQLGDTRLISIDGATLSPLTREAVRKAAQRGQKSSWAMPFGTAGNCTTCHANGPWLRSFVHRGLKGADGHPAVPKRHVGQPEPYRIVGQARLRQGAGQFVAADAHPAVRADPTKKWDPRWLANDTVVATCGSCHAIADEHYCEINVKAAFGKRQSDTAQIRTFYHHLLGADAESVVGAKTPTKPTSRLPGNETAYGWHRDMLQAGRGPLADERSLDAVLDEIDDCCAHPQKESCRWLPPSAYGERVLPKRR